MVQLINCFEVPAGREDEFFALWREVNAYMVRKPGYLSHQLHRSLTEDARYRFVNYAEWESAEHLRAAHDDGFRALALRPAFAPFTSTPAVYQLAHEGTA